MSVHLLSKLQPRIISSRLLCCGIVDRMCWRCGLSLEDVASLSCGQCKAVQAVNHSLSYYQLFGISKKFSLNPAELTDRFRQLQSGVHPDKYAGRSELEQEYSNTCSSFLNSAYKTLMDPIERGNYLLKLERKESVGESDLDVDKEFLLEIMDLNETLASNPDGEELNRISCDNKQMITSLTEQLAEAFGKKDWERVKQLLAKLKYYSNIENKIKELQLETL